MELANLAYAVPAVLAVIILIDVSVLWLTGKQVPELLSQLVVAVFASYFASNLARGNGRAAGNVGNEGNGGSAGSTKKEGK